MNIPRSASMLLLLLAGQLCDAADPVTAFRTGNELIVKFDRLDQLRNRHSQLTAVVQLQGPAGAREIPIDLDDPALQGAAVFDLTQFGRCDSVTVTLKHGPGQLLTQRRIAPLPEQPAAAGLLPPVGSAPSPPERLAYIEPGSALRESKQAAPRIVLPGAPQMRSLALAPAERRVAQRDITFPIIADTDLPLLGGAVLGRQTGFPDDPARTSIYFSCKKAIYDGPRLERWQKFLLEVPVQPAWGTGHGDETITLRPEQFAVHLTDEKTARGVNILGAGDGDLGQKGEIDTDDQGRIYWRVEGGGAFIVRFDPRTRRFEQPPAPIQLQKLVPPGAWMLNDNLCKVTCTRGRVFFTLCNDTRSSGDPRNPLNRRIGGVFSISQDWRDAQTFADDIRLHAGSWETAPYALYPAPPRPDADVRKLAGASVTEAGLLITTAGTKYEGGPWRLDLDERGNTRFFGEVDSLTATKTRDGRAIAPTRLVTVQGIPKGRELNPATGGGRNLIVYSQGSITIPRASVRLLLLDRLEGLALRAERKGAFPTYDGAPAGIVTVRYDLTAKLQATPAAQGALAGSLSGGASMGPAFLVTPIPGEPGRAMAVCEYAGYTLSVLDFSRLDAAKTVRKTFFPPQLPASARLGPYNSAWVRHGADPWLYLSGYTGLSRIPYPRGTAATPAVSADLFNSRLLPTSTAGPARTSMKKIDGLLPVFGGRLLDSGYGLDGRGADAFSTGVELFDPHLLGSGPTNQIPSQTSAHLSRCFALKTLRSRIVWNAADGTRKQEIFAASGSIRRQLINELKDPATGPANLDAKVFLYEVSSPGGLRDRYGFSLPTLDHDRAVEGHLALSPCNRFLVIMTQDAVLYSYHLAQPRFVDGIILRGTSDTDVRPVEFKRPSEIIFTAPDGQIFFLTGPLTPTDAALHFQRVQVGDDGRLSIKPHLSLSLERPAASHDFNGIVRCFLPRPPGGDDGYDFVLGYNQSTVQPFVRVIRGFTEAAKTGR